MAETTTKPTTAAAEDSDSWIWFSQVQSDALETVAKITGPNIAAEFERIERMPLRLKSDPCADLTVWVDLVLGDDLQDRTIPIKPCSAEWLLGEFFGVPKAEWESLRKDDEG